MAGAVCVLQSINEKNDSLFSDHSFKIRRRYKRYTFPFRNFHRLSRHGIMGRSWLPVDNTENTEAGDPYLLSSLKCFFRYLLQKINDLLCFNCRHAVPSAHLLSKFLFVHVFLRDHRILLSKN